MAQVCANVYRPFDLLLLPDGDYVSIGRLKTHPKLALTVKTVTRSKDFSRRTSKSMYKADQHRCVIAIGGAASALYSWGVLDSYSRGCFSTVSNWLRTWILKGNEGPITVYDPTNGNTDLRIVMCSSAPFDDPLQTVRICVQYTRDLVKRGLQDEELKKYGHYQTRLLERRRLLDSCLGPSKLVRWLLVYMRDSSKVPLCVKHLWVNPICASMLREIPSAYHFGKMHPGCRDAMKILADSMINEVKASSNGKNQVLTRSSIRVAECVWKFAQDTLQIKRRQVSGCRAAILVTNQVNEQQLAVLAWELRSRFKILTHLVACDRRILRSKDPYVVTHGKFQIRADVAIERAKPFYDVIIALDSEIDSRGPGMWFRRNSFDLYDFQMKRSESGSMNLSRLTAVFDLKNDGGLAALNCMKRDKQMRLNPLTNQWIRTEDMGADEQKATMQTVRQGLVFQCFSPFHERSDVRTTIQGNAPDDAVDFAKSVSDYLRRIAVKSGYKTASMPSETICNIQ